MCIKILFFGFTYSYLVKKYSKNIIIINTIFNRSRFFYLLFMKGRIMSKQYNTACKN